MHTNSFLLQISGGTFHVVLDFPSALFIAKHCYLIKIYNFLHTRKLQNKKIRNKQPFE